MDMPPSDLPHAAGPSVMSAPAFAVTLGKRAVKNRTVALDPALSRLAARPPAQAYVMLDDSPVQRPVRLEHDARGRRVLVLNGNDVVRHWFQAHCQPGDTLEVRILGPVQFWLGRI